MKTLCLKPARAGDVIRDPVHLRPLPPEGAEVADSPLWRRRLERKEVESTTPERIAAGKAAREAAEAARTAAAPATDTTAEPAARPRKGKE